MADYDYTPTYSGSTWAEYTFPTSALVPGDTLTLKVPFKADEQSDIWSRVRTSVTTFDSTVSTTPGYSSFASFWEEGDPEPPDIAKYYAEIVLVPSSQWKEPFTTIVLYRRSFIGGAEAEPQFNTGSGIRTEDLNRLSTRVQYAIEELEDRSRVYGNPNMWAYDDTLLIEKGTDADVIINGSSFNFTVTTDNEVANAISTATAEDFLFYIEESLVNPGDYTYAGGVLITDTGFLDATVDPTPTSYRIVYLRSYINNTGSTIADGSLVTAKYADGSVTTIKIDDLAVTGAKIAAATITQDKLDPSTSFTANTDTTVQGDGSVGTPLSIETTEHSNVNASKVILQTPAGETGWDQLVGQVAALSSPAPNDTFGLGAKSQGSHDDPDTRVFVQAPHDMTLVISTSTLTKYDGIKVWVSDAADASTDVGVGTGKNGLWGNSWQLWDQCPSSGATGTTLTTFIPKGLYFCVSILGSEAFDYVATKVYHQHKA